LGHLPDYECPKCGPKGPKSGQNRLKIAFLATQTSLKGLFWVGRGGTRLEHNRGIRTDQVGPFVQVKRVKKWPQGLQKWRNEAKIGPNMLK
jgi:hypothetical protein